MDTAAQAHDILFRKVHPVIITAAANGCVEPYWQIRDLIHDSLDDDYQLPVRFLKVVHP